MDVSMNQICTICYRSRCIIPYYIDSYISLLNTSAVLYNSYFFPMTVAQKTDRNIIRETYNLAVIYTYPFRINTYFLPSHIFIYVVCSQEINHTLHTLFEAIKLMVARLPLCRQTILQHHRRHHNLLLPDYHESWAARNLKD